MAKRKKKSDGPRETAHKYPLEGDTKSYLIDKAPRVVLERAARRAARENRSLRVAVIDLLEHYGRGK